MTERFTNLYERRSSKQQLIMVADAIRAINGSLVDPATDRVLFVDPDSAAEVISVDEFWRRVETQPETRFLWYFGPEDRRYCRIRRVGEISIIEFALEGCSERDVDALRATLKKYFTEGTVDGIGLVFDPNGSSEDCDWDRFFIHGEPVNFGGAACQFPELLGVPTCALDRLVGRPVATRLEQHGSMSILQSG